jgi:hypothetical protein
MTTAITPLQQQSIADATTGWSQPLDFAQFDPSLGTLTDIAFGLTGDVAGSVILDNLDRAPAAFGVAFDGGLTLTAPDGTLVASVAPVANAAPTLAAGAMTTLSGVVGSAGTEADFQPSTQPDGLALAPFIGTGSVPLSVGAQATLHVTGPGNMMLVSQAAAGASVTMQYGYMPANAGGGSGSSGGSVNTTDTFVDIALLQAGLVTTAAQTFSFADRTTAWNDSAAIAQFDPALGTLESINITLSDNILAHVGAENLGSTAASFSATDTATLTLDLPVSTSTETVAASVSDTRSLAAFDGSADYAGASGYSTNLAAQTSGSTDVLTDRADLAAFTGHRAVVLPIAGTSAATIDGPGNLMAGLFTEAGGTAAVSYTYIPAAVSTSGDTVGATATAGAADDAVFDATTNQPVAAAAQPYAGAAGGPTQELIDHSSDNLDVSVTSDNWLIGTGGGNDVIIAHGGNNVLFAGGGSNWLFGAGGDDTFSVHAGGGDAWNTVVNFHAGDWLVVWGVSQTAALSWLNGAGAAGYTGLTLDATAADGSSALVTLARYYGTADLANGRLTTGFGGDPANGGGYFYVHANS